MPRFPDPQIPSAAVADNNIIGAVTRALSESADVDIRDLLVDSTEGIVRLTGAVRTLFEKQTAGKLALGARGVKGIENNLVVVASKQRSDSDIECEVDKVLGNYPERNPAKIGVRLVEQGVVHLAGKAASAREESEAIAIAARVPGVKGIVSDIVVAPGIPIDDVKLKNLVNDSLAGDPRIDPFDIDAHVEDGDVHLYGEVDDDEARSTAEELASGTIGVKRVYNNIRIR